MPAHRPNYVNGQEKQDGRTGVKVMSEMSLLVRFKIPMHDAVVVKVLQSQDRLGKIHPGHFHRQWAHVFQQVGTISTLKEQNTLKNNQNHSNSSDPNTPTVQGSNAQTLILRLSALTLTETGSCLS